MKQSAFPEKGLWLKGNLHTHTTLSDGRCTPERQAADYRAMGYDFLAVTDHNVMNELSRYSTPDFLMIPGWERDIPHGMGKCIHIVGLFGEDVEPGSVFRRPQGNEEEMTDQQLVDQMRGENVFLVYAHPQWSRTEPEELRALEGFDAIEVFNTGCEVLCYTGRGDVYWDMLLRMGRHVTAVAADDTHAKDPKTDRFGGWVVVKAPALTHKDIIAALKAGAYYASQGPAIEEFTIEDGVVHVRTSPCREIHVVTWLRRGQSYFATESSLLTEAEYKLAGDESWVRIVCEDAQGKLAWSNPLWLE